LLLLDFYRTDRRHATCISLRVNDDCGLTAILQPVAAAVRKLTCFAAPSS
jgi:hypothetical protein